MHTQRISLSCLVLALLVLPGCASRSLNPVEASQASPVIFTEAVPVSVSVEHSVDLTPGIAGIAMNIANLANLTRQAGSDLLRVRYLYHQNTVLTGVVCAQKSAEVVPDPDIANFAPGDLLVFTKDENDQMRVRRATYSDGQISRISPDDLCNEKYQKFVARRGG